MKEGSRWGTAHGEKETGKVTPLYCSRDLNRGCLIRSNSSTAGRSLDLKNANLIGPLQPLSMSAPISDSHERPKMKQLACQDGRSAPHLISEVLGKRGFREKSICVWCALVNIASRSFYTETVQLVNSREERCASRHYPRLGHWRKRGLGRGGPWRGKSYSIIRTQSGGMRSRLATVFSAAVKKDRATAQNKSPDPAVIANG